MEPLDSIYRWSETLRDRARATAFVRFLWLRLGEDRLFESAGALSYTTAFALVPLSMVAFGVLSGFQTFNVWSKQLQKYIIASFAPGAAGAIGEYLATVKQNVGTLTIAGIIALMVSLLLTLTQIEGAFNHIWRVKTARPKLSRFLIYWTVFTLGALVATASLALSTRFFALAVFETAPGRILEALMLQLAPVAIELVAFTLIFRLVPHRTVQWRHAVLGATVSVVLFELVKWGVGLYLGSFGAYQKAYGPLAFVPIFLLWFYFAWLAVLLGASLASTVSAFRYQPVSMRLPEGYEIYGLLRMLGRFAEARKTGKGLHSDEIRRLEPMLTDALIQELLGQLCVIGLVSRAEGGEWLLSRDLDTLTLGELYEACLLRIPVQEAHLPCRDDALGKVAIAELDQLRLPLRELLKRRVSTLYEDILQ
jgi:membrane protein